MLSITENLRRRALVLMAAVLAGGAGSLRAAVPVLNEVPSDAYGMVVINNIRATANKVSNAATRLNLPIPPDLIGWATRSIGIKEGFDANGSAAIVLLKPADDQAQGNYFAAQPPAVVLLPTTDSKAMLEPFKPGDADKDGISEVSLPTDEDQKGYVAVVDGKWVALAQKKEDLKSYLGHKASFASTASPETLKVFDTNDAVIWGNVEKLSAGGDKAIDDAKDEATGMIDLAATTAKQDAIATALSKQMIASAFSFAKEVTKDAKAGMLTVRLTDSGATFGMVGDYKSDTPMGNFVGAQQAAATSGLGSSLKGLPGGSFLGVFSGALNTAPLASAVSNFGDQLLADPAVVKDERAAQLKMMIDAVKQEIAITQGMHLVLLDPAAGGQNGWISGSALIDTSDPQKVMDLQAQMVKFQDVFSQMNPDIKQTMTFVPDAVTIKGVHLNRATLKMALRAETPDNPISPAVKQMMPMMDKIYGPEGLTMYTGVVGKRVITIYGTDNVTLEASIAAAQGNTDELSATPMIAGTKDQVVANAIMAAYLPITRWMVLAQSAIAPPAAGQAGPGPNVTGAPPMVESVGVTGTMMTGELHLPIATIIGIRESVDNIQKAMMGGGAAGAPGAPNVLP